MPDDWLVVGLGNPDDEYAGTRHNVGADTVRVLADRHGQALKRNKKARCEVADIDVGGARVHVAIPTSYMNTSGGPVQAAAAWFKVAPERLIVVHDDLDLGLGRLRLKQGGGHAGHNGLRDIERALGSRDWIRVRLGIGRPPGRMDAADFVLRRFTTAERPEIDVTIALAADAVEHIVEHGLASAQQRHHAPEPEEP